MMFAQLSKLSAGNARRSFKDKIDFKERAEHFTAEDTPAYYDLLSKIAAGECQGARAFNAWAAATPNPDFAKVLKTVAIREAEHSAAFEKRLCELGQAVDFSDVDPKTEVNLEFLASDASDLDKIKRMSRSRCRFYLLYCCCGITESNILAHGAI